MKFCKLCESVMKKEVKDGTIVFKCHCGETEEGSPYDCCIVTVKLSQDADAQMHGSLIKYAGQDKTALIVEKKCNKCDRLYMRHVSIPVTEVSRYVCVCGEIY